MKTIGSRSEKIIRLAIAGAAIIVAFCAGTARAATVIHYDGITNSYTGGLRAYWGGVTDPHFTLPSPVDTGTEVRTWKYSDTTPISPATGYTGPAIFAALQNDSNAGTFASLNGASGIRSGSLAYTNDVASGFVVAGGGNGSTLTAMIFFKPDVDDGQTVSFDSSSSISLTGAASGVDWTNGMRFVIQSDEQWYISDVVSYKTTNSPVATSRIWTLNDLGSYSFASFNPENAAPLPTAPISGFDTLGFSFTDITSVGYYFSATGATNNFSWVSMWDFTVNATVVSSLYWTADGSSLGGSGTWNTSGSNWSASKTSVSGAAWDGANAAVFISNAATVTVDAVTVERGIQFATDGYTLKDGVITLGGTNIGQNSVTTDSNVGATINSVLAGANGLTKAGAGTLILGGANTFSGGTAVSAGKLELKAGSGSALGNVTSVIVGSGATLLLSKSEQVNNAATVTLSGGTIERAGGVSEVFGNLNLTAASFLDYGTGDTGTLTFGTYTPSSLLTVGNFFEGNKLVFSSNIGSDINNTNLFKFDNAFTTEWNGSTFTITAIPEPSAYVVAAALLGVMASRLLLSLLAGAQKIFPVRFIQRESCGQG